METEDSAAKTKFLGLSKDQSILALVAMFIVSVLLNGFTVAYASHLSGERDSDIQALVLDNLRHNCAQRAFAQSQVVSTADFLAKHAGDLYLGGVKVPRAQLVDQLNRQRAFRDTFNDLDCRAFDGPGPG